MGPYSLIYKKGENKMVKKNNKLNKILILLTSFQTLLLGIVFIIQVLRIYYGNSKVFTK